MPQNKMQKISKTLDFKGDEMKKGRKPAFERVANGARTHGL
jgi:hypothetical protein